MNWYQMLMGIGYLLVFLVALIGAAFVLKWQQRPKSPFKADTRLLRQPGESLLKKLQKMDDDFPLVLLGAMVAPVLLSLFAFGTLVKWKLASPRMAVGLVITILMAATIASAWFVAWMALRRARHYLGYFGERVVAERLEPLRGEGWRIIHDVPAKVGKKKFNVDHVAIGRTGIYAIETKARRKGGAIKGRKDHEVVYDGKMMLWPDKNEEPYGVKKAIDRARWLEGWLTEAIGEKLEVKPILAFPEWFVKEACVDPRLRVVSSSLLCSVLTAGRTVLTAEQIDRFARPLEQRCRDVEY